MQYSDERWAATIPYHSRVIATVTAAIAAAAAYRDAKALFTDWRSGFYEHNKLANVYTAFELQRRYVVAAAAACGCISCPRCRMALTVPEASLGVHYHDLSNNIC